MGLYREDAMNRGPSARFRVEVAQATGKAQLLVELLHLLHRLHKEELELVPSLDNAHRKGLLSHI